MLDIAHTILYRAKRWLLAGGSIDLNSLNPSFWAGIAQSV